MYQIKPMERKKHKGYGVICPDGRLANNWIYPTRKEAEKKLKLLEAWYG
jgi:hypothetical protein